MHAWDARLRASGFGLRAAGFGHRAAMDPATTLQVVHALVRALWYKGFRGFVHKALCRTGSPRPSGASRGLRQGVPPAASPPVAEAPRGACTGLGGPQCACASAVQGGGRAPAALAPRAAASTPLSPRDESGSCARAGRGVRTSVGTDNRVRASELPQAASAPTTARSRGVTADRGVGAVAPPGAARKTPSLLSPFPIPVLLPRREQGGVPRWRADLPSSCPLPSSYIPQTKKSIGVQLLTMDILAPGSMKNAAKCDT